jgi:hypothetical protein
VATKVSETANAIGFYLRERDLEVVLELDANRADEEPFRLERLKLLASILGYQEDKIEKLSGL